MSKIRLYKGSAPQTPAAGEVLLYVKTDGRFYFLNELGVEEAMKPTGAGTGDLLSDGTVPLTANWDVGSFKITAQQLESDVVTGTAPLVVASTTLVPNLNADQVDGNEAAALLSRANHTGTQLASTVSDFQTQVSANTDVTANTAKLTADATNVAAAGAVMDSDISEAEGFLRKTGAGAYEGIKSNLNASVAPTTTDDSVAGYAVGSQWINTMSDTLYFCLDATASAAVWQEVGAGGGGMTVTTVKTGNYTAAEGEYVPVDSSGGSFTVTLPATPGAQAQVAVVDVGKACSTSPVTVARNGETIDGAATDFSLDQNNGGAWFMYDGTSDWDTHLEGVPEVVNINDFATGFGGVNAQTGTTYTFADADLAELVTASNAAASTYSIPDSLAAVGETLNVLNIGAGTVTVDCPGTDTLASTANNLATGKAGTIVKTAATTWWLIGGSA
jgi:hypothetical protein